MEHQFRAQCGTDLPTGAWFLADEHNMLPQVCLAIVLHALVTALLHTLVTILLHSLVTILLHTLVTILLDTLGTNFCCMLR